MSSTEEFNIRVMSSVWYAVDNDVIGGWAIGLTDKPLSEYDHRHGDLWLADVMTEASAKYIVNLHNEALAGRRIYREEH